MIGYSLENCINPYTRTVIVEQEIGIIESGKRKEKRWKAKLTVP